MNADKLSQLPPNVETIPLGHDEKGNPLVGAVPRITPPPVNDRAGAFNLLHDQLKTRLHHSLINRWIDNPVVEGELFGALMPLVWMAYNMEPYPALDAPPRRPGTGPLSITIGPTNPPG